MLSDWERDLISDFLILEIKEITGASFAKAQCGEGNVI
jgi:hypothetical protein